ncbi:T6SS phospholipase effector Tle1-like catalytic domain-containing protein [Agrobacterium tumefaciens]|uniref:phospholipase effector Tle1 domain-containing protein n=1 Tax=Agrobacterium tumefaciens TaxID=358 RepID=UPI0016595BE2|nr:DUF2235 domain-containing protein [Agrobacterium tumefaciens]QNP78604.1 DUF2235 domain-containing protein [Agrobacterium tumefaciens]
MIDGTRVSANQTSEYCGYSNVFELAYMLQLKDRSEDLRPQIVFYTSGISSQPDTRDLFSSATGRAIRSQILDQYTNLCSNYDFELHDDWALRDRIYLFGFSRGAMAARAVAGLIMEYGLLRPEHVRYAPKIVDDWERREPRPNYVDLVEVSVDFLGVFDSVMGGIERMKMFNPIRFPHERLSQHCVTGIHLLSIDEDRAMFRNRSWESHDRLDVGMMRQIWVPGVHSDIGGTASEFWGRISLLTMTYYIDRMTQLRLDDAWLQKKERAVRSDFRDQAYRIKQHRPLSPLASTRVPQGTIEANEELHPIIDILPQDIEYNNHRRFPWRDKYFSSGFGPLPRDDGLDQYFRDIVNA